ncbi:MAG: hypothetical protein ACPGJS_01955 [Flammeovirgaceae bacterium]
MATVNAAELFVGAALIMAISTSCGTFSTIKCSNEFSAKQFEMMQLINDLEAYHTLYESNILKTLKNRNPVKQSVTDKSYEFVIILNKISLFRLSLHRE